MKISHLRRNALSVLKNPAQLSAYIQWTIGRLTGEPTRLIAGHKMHGFQRFSEYWNINSVTSSESELAFIRLISSQYLGPCLDIGSNIGQMAVILREATQREIHCFEPHPKTFKSLESNCRPPNFIANQLALSNSSGIVKFSSGRSTTLNRMIIGKMSGEAFYEVQADTVDRYMISHNIERASLVKIDVEGAEPLVLQGMREHLAKHKIGALLIEIVPRQLAQFGFTVKDILDVTTDYGYLPYNVQDLSRSLSLAELENSVGPNFAFMRAPVKVRPQR